MRELLARGREERKRIVEEMAPEDRPIGSVAAIRYDDFLTHPAECFEYALREGPLHILCPDGGVCALLSKRTSK